MNLICVRQRRSISYTRTVVRECFKGDDVGRVAVKQCFKLLSFFYIYHIK